MNSEPNIYLTRRDLLVEMIEVRFPTSRRSTIKAAKYEYATYMKILIPTSRFFDTIINVENHGFHVFFPPIVLIQHL